MAVSRNTLHTPVRIREFFVDPEDRHLYDADFKKTRAKAVLLDRLMRIVWTVCMSPGPRIWERVSAVQDLVQEHWIENPEQAVVELQEIVNRDEAALDKTRDQMRANGATDADIAEWLPAIDVRLEGRFGEALETYAKYVIALGAIDREEKANVIELMCLSDEGDPRAHRELERIGEKGAA